MGADRRDHSTLWAIMAAPARRLMWRFNTGPTCPGLVMSISAVIRRFSCPSSSARTRRNGRENCPCLCLHSRKAGPCCQTAEIAGPQQADRKHDRAAGRPGQELAEGYRLGIGRLTEPAAAHHKFVAEIADMGDRPAKAGDAQARENAQDLDCRSRRAAALLDGGGG